MESARTSRSYWTKLCTKIIYTLLQGFVLLLQISYHKKSFLTTPNIENQFRSSTESLKKTWVFAYSLWTFNFIFSNFDEKLLYQNYLHLIAKFCVTASNILSKEIFYNNTKHRKQISKFHLILPNRLINKDEGQNSYAWAFAYSLWTWKFVFSDSD